MSTTQGNLELLDHPVAQALLESRTPARLAYNWTDGTPRVIPIWFHWNGAELVLAAAPTSPKVRAITGHPYVALSIDDPNPPYKVLLIRGTADVAIHEGMVPEYGVCAERYFGEEFGRAWAEEQRRRIDRMARIVVQPHWVGVIDFETRFPQDFESK